MRKTLFNYLVSDEDSVAMVPADRWVARGSVDERPSLPFVVYAFGLTDPALGPVRSQTVELWVHDEPGDYTRIDDILDAIEKNAENLLQYESDGWRIMSVEWNGRSGDLGDDGFRTATRNVTLLARGRRL
jgi:hypothetical protein